MRKARKYNDDDEDPDNFHLGYTPPAVSARRKHTRHRTIHEAKFDCAIKATTAPPISGNLNLPRQQVRRNHTSSSFFLPTYSQRKGDQTNSFLAPVITKQPPGSHRTPVKNNSVQVLDQDHSSGGRKRNDNHYLNGKAEEPPQNQNQMHSPDRLESVPNNIKAQRQPSGKTQRAREMLADIMNRTLAKSIMVDDYDDKSVDISVDPPSSSTGGQSIKAGSYRAPNMQNQSYKKQTTTNKPTATRKTTRPQYTELKKSLFTEATQLATKTTAKMGPGSQQLGLLDRVRGHFFALKYRTTIEVEGVGEYQIEVTNLVNTRTFGERHIVPSLLSMASRQKIQVNRCRRLIMQQQKAIKPQSRNPELNQADLSQNRALPNKKEEGLRLLAKVFKHHLNRNFDFLKMGSIDYKRSMLAKQQSMNYRKQRGIDLLNNLMRSHDIVSKTKVFCKWREVTNEQNSRSSHSTNNSNSRSQGNVESLLNQLRELQNRTDRQFSECETTRVSSMSRQTKGEAKLAKRKKNALNHIEQLVLQRLSDYFTCWKLKVLLGSQTEQMQLLPSSPLKIFDHDAELHLDFSTFRREIQDEERYRDPLRSHIKVRQVDRGSSSSKNLLKEERKQNNSVDNYTFDLTMLGEGIDEEDEGSQRQLTNSELFLSGAETPYTSQPDSNQSVDQVDDLLAELNELVGFRQKTESSNLIRLEGEGGSSNMNDSQFSQVPRRVSFSQVEADQLLSDSTLNANENKDH